MFRTVAVFAAVLAIALPASRAAAQDISWAYYPEPCEEAESLADLTVDAGGFGIYYFGSQPITGCDRQPAASCTERVRVYPPHGPSPADNLACDPALNGCGKPFSDVDDPWIYIPDIEEWHAIMVDAVVRGATDPEVETKIALVRPHFPTRYQGVGDPDVLIALAELAAAIDDGVSAPAVINVSFGRLHQSDDARSAACDADLCREGALSCQIARLLGYLTRPRAGGRTVAVAALGNDHSGLFPAGLEEVAAVGMVDATELAGTGRVRPAWETPAAPDALMPGNGLCLELPTYDQDPDGQQRWIETVAPAGSSFSAAFFTGWFSDLLLSRPDEALDHLARGPRWEPLETCPQGGCPFVLTHGGVTFASPSGNGSDRMRAALYDNPAHCGPPARRSLSALLEEADDKPWVRYDSLVELTARTYRPAPEPNPCIPCVVGMENELQAPPAKLAAAAREGTPGGFRRQFWVDLEIDLHTLWMLDNELTLHDLYLRVGSELKHVALLDWQLLAIQEGEIGYMFLSGFFRYLDLSEQPSLIAVLSRRDPSGNPEHFWRSTAMIVR